MKVLAWIEETAKRSLTRFGAASLWGLALFLLLSYLNLWEKDHIDLLAVLFALGNGALSSVVIKIFLEIKNRKVMPLIYLFPGVIFYGLFSLYQAKSYLILGGLGLAAALTGLLVFLLSAEKKGKSAFPPPLHRGGECPFISSVLALVDRGFLFRLFRGWVEYVPRGNSGGP